MNSQVTPLGFMRKRQLPLCQDYLQHPERALITDWAQTESDSIAANWPLHTRVSVDRRNPTSIDIGVHQAVGGDSDQPTPGDILCGALAACLDSTLRVIANGYGVDLKRLVITVEGKVDVRGTLMVDSNVPVSFLRFNVDVDIEAKNPVSEEQLAMLLNAAERSCIVLQTLRGAPEVVINQH